MHRYMPYDDMCQTINNRIAVTQNTCLVNCTTSFCRDTHTAACPVSKELMEKWARMYAVGPVIPKQRLPTIFTTPTLDPGLCRTHGFKVWHATLCYGSWGEHNRAASIFLHGLRFARNDSMMCVEGALRAWMLHKSLPWQMPEQCWSLCRGLCALRPARVRALYVSWEGNLGRLPSLSIPLASLCCVNVLSNSFSFSPRGRPAVSWWFQAHYFRGILTLNAWQQSEKQAYDLAVSKL
jgi:hypothetical protein